MVFAALTDEGLAQAKQADSAYRTFLRETVLTSVSAADLATVANLVSRLGDLGAVEAEVPGFELSPRSPNAPDRRSRDREGSAADRRAPERA